MTVDLSGTTILAEVIYLAPGQQPPAGEDCVVVSHPRAGRIDISGMTVRPDGVTTFSESSVGGSLERAVIRAQALADKHDISKVYVEPSNPS